MTESRFCILAIDPGLSGALAFYWPDGAGGVIKVYDMPRVLNDIDPHELTRIIKRHTPTVAVIEKVGPMPRDGSMQAWRFSAANTTAKVVCAVLGIPTSLVPPRVWKEGMKVGGGPQGKERCRELALRMFPAHADQFARKKDQGRAEAALLAYYVNEKFIFNREA